MCFLFNTVTSISQATVRSSRKNHNYLKILIINVTVHKRHKVNCPRRSRSLNEYKALKRSALNTRRRIRIIISALIKYKQCKNN